MPTTGIDEGRVGAETRGMILSAATSAKDTSVPAKMITNRAMSETGAVGARGAETKGDRMTGTPIVGTKTGGTKRIRSAAVAATQVATTGRSRALGMRRPPQHPDPMLPTQIRAPCAVVGPYTRHAPTIPPLQPTTQNPPNPRRKPPLWQK